MEMAYALGRRVQCAHDFRADALDRGFDLLVSDLDRTELDPVESLGVLAETGVAPDANFLDDPSDDFFCPEIGAEGFAYPLADGRWQRFGVNRQAAAANQQRLACGRGVWKPTDQPTYPAHIQFEHSESG
jgi:hypothetical protein